MGEYLKHNGRSIVRKEWLWFWVKWGIAMLLRVSSQTTGDHMYQWHSWSCTLHLHGWVGWNLLTHWCNSSLGGNCCAYSQWHPMYISGKQMAYASSSPGDSSLMSEYINFSAPKRQQIVPSFACIPGPSRKTSEIEEFFQMIAEEKQKKPIVLSLVHPYSNGFCVVQWASSEMHAEYFQASPRRKWLHWVANTSWEPSSCGGHAGNDCSHGDDDRKPD